MNELYNRIESAAAKKGMSVKALAEKAGIHRGRIYYLNNRPDASLSAKNLKKISDTLGVSTEWLLNGDMPGRIIHINLEKKNRGIDAAVAKMTDGELIEFISAFTAELQRRRNAEDQP